MRKAKILIVEDETVVLEKNKEFLEGQGHEIWTARRLEEARALVRQVSPDMILLDVMLPDGSGFDFCREIRGYTAAWVCLSPAAYHLPLTACGV
jgi:DNA-binding response OmpR family regulator